MHFADIIDDAMHRDGRVITFAMRPGYRHRAKRDRGRTRESDIIPRLWHGMRRREVSARHLPIRYLPRQDEIDPELARIVSPRGGG